MTEKALLFDFFGVVHNNPVGDFLVANKHQELLESQWFKDSAKTLDLGEQTMDWFYDKLAYLTGNTKDFVVREVDKLAYANVELIAYIRELKTQGAKVGLLSNSSIEYISPFLHKYGLEKVFNPLLISAEIKIAKPDERAFRIATKMLGEEFDSVLFIDDTWKNVESAQKLGMKAIHFKDNNSVLQGIEQAWK